MMRRCAMHFQSPPAPPPHRSHLNILHTDTTKKNPECFKRIVRSDITFCTRSRLVCALDICAEVTGRAYSLKRFSPNRDRIYEAPLAQPAGNFNIVIIGRLPPPIRTQITITLCRKMQRRLRMRTGDLRRTKKKESVQCARACDRAHARTRTCQIIAQANWRPQCERVRANFRAHIYLTPN